MPSYFIVYKPYDTLSQFTREVPEHRTLADLAEFPPEVYPVGRLDKDSEGLLLLTDDKKLNHQLLNPTHKHARTYWVQVEGTPTEEAIKHLQKGVNIRINKKTHKTRKAKVKTIAPPMVPERNPPVRFRANIPTTWLEIILTEGKNRQVRRMCAKVGYPVLRLIRSAMVNIKLEKLLPGDVKELKKADLYRKLEMEE